MTCKHILLIIFLNTPELFFHTIKWLQVLLCISNNSIKHLSFVYTQFKHQNSSIWPIDRTLSGTTTPGQSRLGSNGNEELLHARQSFRMGASPSDVLWHIQDISCGVLTPPQTVVGVYYSLPTQPTELNSVLDWTNDNQLYSDNYPVYIANKGIEHKESHMNTEK